MNQNQTLGLDRYRRVLPEAEFSALDAWVSSFYPFQREWLLEESDLSIANKARQIGASHTTGAVGVLWGAFHGELTTIISIGDTESAEVLEKARRHAFVLTQLGSNMARMTRNNSREVHFASGGRIIALPSSGGRGFTGNVFLDEFGYQEHAAKVWDAAAAVTLLGGRLRVASTPNGVGNDFHQLWELARLKNSGWTTHEINIERAIADGYPLDLKKCWSRAKGDPRLFSQMFSCKFLDGQQQYIPSKLIEAATCDVYCPEDGVAYAGLDIGRTADLTVLCIVRVDEQKVAHVIHIESKKRTSHEDLEELAAMAFGPVFRCKRLCVDASGMGAFPAERLQKKFGRTKVEPVVFTLRSKEDLATALYQRFAEQTIRIPKGDELRDDISSLRRIVTSAGNIRYDAPHTDRGHADRAWALALAIHGCSGPGRAKHEVHDHNTEANTQWT